MFAKEKHPLNMFAVGEVCGNFIAKIEQVSSASRFLKYDASLSFIILVFLLKSSKSHPLC